MRRYRVSQTPCIVNAGNRSENFRWDLLVQFDVMVKLLHHGAAQGFNFAPLVAGNNGSPFNWRDIGTEMLLAFLNFIDLGPLLAFHQNLDSAIRQFQELQNGGNTAYLEHILNGRLVFGSGFLSHKHDAPLGFHGRFQRLDTLGTTHEQRNDHMRKHHDIPQRQKWQIDRSRGK